MAIFYEKLQNRLKTEGEPPALIQLMYTKIAQQDDKIE